MDHIDPYRYIAARRRAVAIRASRLTFSSSTFLFQYPKKIGMYLTAAPKNMSLCLLERIHKIVKDDKKLIKYSKI